VSTTDAAAREQIGPNAATQLLAALRGAGLERFAADLFMDAGVPVWLHRPPADMVDAAEVAKLHHTLRARLPIAVADAVLAQAGRLTADYLLAHRIPKLAQRVLRLLPARLAAMALVPAIRSHAWTFAGAGLVSARVGRHVVIDIAGNPLCRGLSDSEPICAWHRAVFQRLFTELVSRDASVVETRCEARGDPSCRFEIALRAAMVARQDGG
jgi:divinyl protochlorophyllide a 8-vinyl-reductase